MTRRITEAEIVVLIFLVFLLTQIFYPFFRWFFQGLGLSPLFYIPALMCFLYAIYSEFRAVYTSKWSPYRAVFDLLLILSFLVGVLHTQSLIAPTFGLWVLNPFFFGLAAGSILLACFQRQKNIPLILLGIIFFGLLIDKFEYNFPWRGLESEVAGVSVTVSKEWEVYGVRRLSGFQSSSIECSRLILFFLVFILLGTHKAFIKFIVAGLAFYFIGLTTTKVTFLAAIPVTILLLLPRGSQIYTAKGILSFFFLLGLSLPIYSFVLQWPFDIRDAEAARTLFSIEERYTNMWPHNLSHVLDHGNLLLGSGLGNFGAAAVKFGSILIPASDNLYIYVYQISGLVGLLFMCFMMTKYLVIPFSTTFMSRFVLVFMPTIVTTGVTDGSFESPVTAMVFGICISQIMGKRAESIEWPASGNSRIPLSQKET